MPFVQNNICLGKEIEVEQILEMNPDLSPGSSYDIPNKLPKFPPKAGSRRHKVDLRQTDR